MREYSIGRLGGFSYSPEEDTPAFELDLPQVEAAVAEERLARVLAVRDEVLANGQAAWVGHELDVLIDEASVPSNDGPIAVGRTAMDAPRGRSGRLRARRRARGRSAFARSSRRR